MATVVQSGPPIALTIGATATWATNRQENNAVAMTSGVTATWLPTVILDWGTPGMTITSTASWWQLALKKNFVWASRMSQMDFAAALDGEFTENKMPWDGWTYQILQLGNMAVVLGQDGITAMIPDGFEWGMKTLHFRGLHDKLTACGVGHPDDFRSIVFIDRRHIFGEIKRDGSVTLTDYSVYFRDLGPCAVMLYDPTWDVVHITDGTHGWIWTESGLGNGPVNLTGIGWQRGETFAVGSSTIVFDPLNICLDVFDLGTREMKTITGVDLNTNLIGDAYTAFDYRWNKADAYVTSPWTKLTREGKGHLMVSGVEFRWRLKLLAYEDIQLDKAVFYVKVADSVTLQGAA